MTNKISVLFVDDEPLILRGVKRHTRAFRDDWQLHFAAGGVEAVKIITRERVDLIVTDMRMPEVDGTRLLEWISEYHPEIIRIVLSGEAKLDEIYRIVGRSHRFLAKPCTPDALISVIKQVVEARGRDEDLLRGGGMALLDNLHTPAFLLGELQAKLSDETATVNDVAGIVKRDPSLSLRVLQMANSTYFKRSISTCSIRRAVSHIGLERLAELESVNRLGQPAPDGLPEAVAPGTASALANAAVQASEELDLTPDEVNAVYISGLCLRSTVVDPEAPLGHVARRAAYVSVLFGLPEVLTSALRTLSLLEPNAEFTRWPELIAEAVRSSRPEGMEVAA
ncbi:hypothetical protein GCM10011316_22030 [Roseibium aquae]|uniref:Response regulatory domain-containing protein n=1 Tax=Roseibium aquae TaxID=1323746 RepID=A0A916X0R0_9HYPH|nr:response regulator [Roseibium aquae]GGB49503.1 hypothetical protein GCM10011316_22030 [Roseibium aquae]